MWTYHDQFLLDIKKCWDSSPLATSPTTTLYLKLKSIRKMLKAWNHHVFGNVHVNLSAAEDVVLKAEHAYDLHPSSGNSASLDEAKNFLSRSLLQHECFWRQKSRVKWLAKGNRNTKFFHSTSMAKRKKCAYLSFKMLQGYSHQILRI